jgi:hypothetical protein
MIWLYVVSFILLVGAEVNDEIWKGLGAGRWRGYETVINYPWSMDD